MNVSLTGHSESAVTEVVVLDNANVSPSVRHNLTNRTAISKFFSSQSLEKTKKKKKSVFVDDLFAFLRPHEVRGEAEAGQGAQGGEGQISG